MRYLTKSGADRSGMMPRPIGAGTVLVLFMAMFVPGVASATGSSARQAVIQQVRAWDQAAAHRDTKALDGILADNFTITLASGQVEDKQGYLLRFVKAPQMTLNVSYKSTSVRVRLYGDIAIVTGKSPAKEPYRGPATFGDYRFTDVYLRNGGNWQAVASQLTRAAISPGKKSAPRH